MPITFQPVALPHWPPGGTAARNVRSDIDRWVRSEAMGALVRCFGGAPPTGTADEAIAHLVEFSSVWDYRRGGRERGDILAIDYAEEIDELVCQAAKALGLSGRHHPSNDTYQHVLVLGGGPRTALARPHYAAELLRGAVESEHVSALSSLRRMSEAEITFALSQGMTDVSVEAEVMAAGMMRAFGIDSAPVRRVGRTSVGTCWWTLEFTATGRTVTVIAAPSSDPGRRANTADTLTGWADLVSTPRRGDHLLVVTTDLFVPFQHADAIRLLGLRFGCGVDTVGLDALKYGTWLRANTHTAILQEVRSAVLAMNRLAGACTPEGAVAEA
jgi:hypothetical protein